MNKHIELEDFNEVSKKIDNVEKFLFEGKKILNSDEAARYLNISKSYLFRLTSKKEIDHYKPKGKMIFFLRSDLDKYMLTNKIEKGGKK